MVVVTTPALAEAWTPAWPDSKNPDSAERPTPSENRILTDRSLSRLSLLPV